MNFQDGDQLSAVSNARQLAAQNFIKVNIFFPFCFQVLFLFFASKTLYANNASSFRGQTRQKRKKIKIQKFLQKARNSIKKLDFKQTKKKQKENMKI